MVTVNFIDEGMSHKVHTRGESLALIDRYWPRYEKQDDSEMQMNSLDKVGYFLNKAAEECEKLDIPAVFGYMLDDSECIIATYGDFIPAINLTNAIQRGIVNELEKEVTN
ncbi:hypothetical protein DW084_16500 [Enterococcus casseliflavus]|jgi:hypothetical protein|uniref:Uncharacterized protein n=1 Tax=Enterococcus casseliflavus TaxID=37734 RepID=A0A415ENN5_ENTCA|nr:hypothetical protein DW084_16500 [Enterococcus casseliflavus]